MSSINGFINLSSVPSNNAKNNLSVMNKLLQHRTNSTDSNWIHDRAFVGFGRKDIETPGYKIVIDSEILNRNEFNANTDLDAISFAYEKYGNACPGHLRGNFSFAAWDEANQTLFCARDKFGIKPFYYTVINGVLFFASEVKALLPFVQKIDTDIEALKDYLTFQFCLDGKTLFKGIHELPPAHTLSVQNGQIKIERYWEVFFNIDFDHTEKYFEEMLESLIFESVKLNCSSPGPVGVYISGGLDSSTIACIASKIAPEKEMIGFHGKFSEFGENFDESHYAQSVAKHSNFEIVSRDISCKDFIDNIQKTLYHLDFPVAGPGVLPQYLISETASKYRKTILGGQGGDEIFGGYIRYLIAYFEQCIKGAIEGRMNSGNFVLTYQSIIPNLTALMEYKPMLEKFWKNGLFDEMDKRYFNLVNRAPDLGDVIDWEVLGDYSSYEVFRSIFKGGNVGKESYLDQMMHFDFKTSLPALLQIEDRMASAWGINAKVPFLDNKIVELVASIPANIKIKDGRMKYILHKVAQKYLPETVLSRRDKKGFPTPFNKWIRGGAKDFIYDIFTSSAAKSRGFVDYHKVIHKIDTENEFARNVWGFLCLELWQREFHDKQSHYKSLAN